MKVIRLFKNIDWSGVTGELTIPEGFILNGQGFNILLGNGSLQGDVEGRAIYNGEPYEKKRPY